MGPTAVPALISSWYHSPSAVSPTRTAPTRRWPLASLADHQLVSRQAGIGVTASSVPGWPRKSPAENTPTPETLRLVAGTEPV